MRQQSLGESCDGRPAIAIASVLVANGAEALRDQSIEVAPFAPDGAPQPLASQHRDAIPSGTHVRLVRQASGREAVRMTNSIAVKCAAAMGESKPQVEILRIDEILIKGAGILEQAPARYDARRADKIPAQQATFQLRLRNEVPGSFDFLSRDCAVCDLERQYRWFKYAALAVDVLEVRKRKASFRMLIKCGN